MGKRRLTKDDLRVNIRPFARREPEGTCANALQQVLEDLDAANDEIARLTEEVTALRLKLVKSANEVDRLTELVPDPPQPEAKDENPQPEAEVARKPKAKPVEEGKKNV